MSRFFIISNILLLLLIKSSFSESDSTLLVINPTIDENSPTGCYIPIDLEDCFIEMDKMLSEEFIEIIKTGDEKDLYEYHMSLGLWIRNNWGLWGESHLKDFFTSYEIYHPDDMSSIIITSYYRNLNDLPIDLSEQIEYYKEYWKNIDDEKIENQELEKRDDEFEDDDY